MAVNDEEKTKEQLVRELVDLRQLVSERGHEGAQGRRCVSEGEGAQRLGLREMPETGQLHYKGQENDVAFCVDRVADCREKGVLGWFK